MSFVFTLVEVLVEVLLLERVEVEVLVVLVVLLDLVEVEVLVVLVFVEVSFFSCSLFTAVRS